MRAEAVDLARFVALRDSVAAVAAILRPHHIPVAPLKGALLVVGFAREPSSRAIGDVDLLVPADRFDDARRVLGYAGAREVVADPEGRTFTASVPGAHFTVDLHRRLCRRSLYRLDESAIFARSRVDTAAFGAEVRLLTPEDAFAHAVAHHAGGRPLGPIERLASDLALLEPRIDEDRLVTALHEAGLIRALAFVRLDLARRDRPRPRLEDLAGRLGTTSADDAIARAALGLVGPGRPTLVDSLARHLTNASGVESAASLGWHVVTSVAHRLRGG